MQPEKPQKGNPHQLTIKQHVFPARSIERFVRSDGTVSVKRRQASNKLKDLILSPWDEMFCAKRVWDQRAESGYMRRIEAEFQELADRIVAGQRALSVNESGIVTTFFALWRSRFHFQHYPLSDPVMSGVSGETLSKDQEEILEKKGASFIRSDQTIPSRFTSGVLIEIKIDEMACSLKDYKWGVVSAEEGEFVLPDTFGKWCIVPVTPTVCLVCNQVDTRIARHQVVELNRDAVQAAKQYFVARDFSQCPL